jgi:quercetin dioxygenase-like cupin family protein
MTDAEPFVVRDLAGLDLPERTMSAYDRPIGLRLLHEDPDSGVELYVVEYPAGTRAAWHRHSVAHAIVVLDGRLEVNGEQIGPGDLCRYAAGAPMKHQPAAGSACRFLMIFEGESDVTVLDDQVEPE